MRKAVRAIVINRDKMLVMSRNKFGLKYYTLIGGGVDVGENNEQALLREVAEETGIDLVNPRLVFIDEAGEIYGTQYVYLCNYVGGDPALNANSEEYKINQLGKNLYEPMWLPINELKGSSFRSDKLKEALLEYLPKGFPNEVVKL